MKILLFFPFLLALALVSAMPARRPHARSADLLLVEMVKTLNHLKDVGHMLVADVIDVHDCKREDFCRAERVLSNVDEEFREKGKIVRQLKEYNKDFEGKCTIVKAKEIELKNLLRHLHTCAQKTYAQLKH